MMSATWQFGKCSVVIFKVRSLSFRFLYLAGKLLFCDANGWRRL